MPNHLEIIVTFVLTFPTCVVVWMLFSGRVNRHPELALGTSAALLVIGILAIGFWWIAGGACDLEYWLHGPTHCVWL